MNNERFSISKAECSQWINETCNAFFKTQYKDARLKSSKMEDIFDSIEIRSCFKINYSTTLENYTIVYYAKKRQIIMINLKTKKIVSVKCQKTDYFSASIGIAICWARMNDKEIPNYLKRYRIEGQ